MTLSGPVRCGASFVASCILSSVSEHTGTQKQQTASVEQVNDGASYNHRQGTGSDADNGVHNGNNIGHSWPEWIL